MESRCEPRATALPYISPPVILVIGPSWWAKGFDPHLLSERMVLDLRTVGPLLSP